MNLSNRIKTYFIITTLIVITILSYYYTHALNKSLHFTRGKVDLSKTDFGKHGLINLDGEWEFYWNQLLEPSDFRQGNQHDFNYIHVPENWLKDQEGNEYPNKGYATYRIVIDNIPDSKYFGLKKANVRNSSKIYINGDLVLQDGVVSGVRPTFPTKPTLRHKMYIKSEF